jgi:hypothetical protein
VLRSGLKDPTHHRHVTPQRDACDARLLTIWVNIVMGGWHRRGSWASALRAAATRRLHARPGRPRTVALAGLAPTRPPAPSAGHILGVTRWLAASKGQGGLGPSHARCGRSDARHYADRSPDARRLSRSLSGWPASAEALSMSSWTTSVAELRENASISCLRACR